MNSFLRWATGTLVLASVVHFAVILAYPYTAMNRLMAGIEKQAGAPNTAIYPPRADPSSHHVVRPSPDLYYVICVFDVSRGPIYIRGPVVSTYWSLSLYGANSDNFYVVSKAKKGEKWADLVLAKQGTDVTNIHHPIVTPPSTRGVAVYRMLIDSEKRAKVRNILRRRAGCGPLVE